MKTTDKALLVVLVALVVAYIAYNKSRSDSGMRADSFSPDVVPQQWIPPVPLALDTSLAYPEVFEASFLSNTKALMGNDTVAFRLQSLGYLQCSTGKILACDDVTQSNRPAFIEQFPIGKFPVQLGLITANSYDVVLFSRIIFSPDTVDHWSLALVPGQEPRDLRDSVTYCFSVDAGIALFVDSASNEVFLRSGQWAEAFAYRENTNGYFHNFPGGNMAVFIAGLGDGCYSTYIGYTKEGEPCRLLIDFGLIPWWEEPVRSEQ